MAIGAYFRKVFRLRGGGDDARTVAWNTMRTTLNLAKEASSGLPLIGLEGAIAGVIAVIDAIDVSRDERRQAWTADDDHHRLRKGI